MILLLGRLYIKHVNIVYNKTKGNKRKHFVLYYINSIYTKLYLPASGSANLTALCYHGKYFRL